MDILRGTNVLHVKKLMLYILYTFQGILHDTIVLF